MLNETFFKLPNVEVLDIKLRKGVDKKFLPILGYDPILNNTKNKISEMTYTKWTKLRKNFNIYEFPFDPETVTKPISRAYTKLLEIVKDLDIDITGNTLHLAEAPGGFIQSTKYMKQKLNLNDDLYYTFSLIGNKKIPVYNKMLLKDRNVVFLSNYKNKGDLYNVNNIKNLISTLCKKNIKFITCDGGFAENKDFCSKEQLHHHLIFNEIVTSLLILENGGTLVLKIFDIFTQLTFDFVYILSFLFSEVYICKPITSRPTNSEKYLVCKNFTKLKLSNSVRNSIQFLCSDGIHKYESFIDKKNCSQELVKAIKTINIQFMNSQIDSINNILEIDSLNLKFQNSKESVQEWIEKYY
jgi:23S rRNA U2552 (ribose-2'-O)-methylase RlmE/FtsJ